MIKDCTCCLWNLGYVDWIDLHDQNVPPTSHVDQGENGRISAIATIPEILPLDFHSLEQIQKSCRCYNRVDSDLSLVEYAQTPVQDIRRAYKQLGSGRCLQSLEVNDFKQQISQWIEIAGVDFIRREDLRQNVDQMPQWGKAHVPEAEHLIERRRLKWPQAADSRCAVPECREAFSAAIRPSNRNPICQDDGIHGS